MSKTKLELTWIGKDKQPRLEPRILLEDATKSHGAKDCENLLIHGDNLLALKALEQDYAGKIKCIYIDPPYNTGTAFEHYDDGIEHSIWLSLIRDRLVVLRNLLREDGSIWISIDDTECHYLKVMCDEVFGRRNFVTNVIWQKKYSPANDAIWFSDNHDHILVYARNKDVWRPIKLKRTDKNNSAYKNPDNDPRGPWKAGDYTCAKTADERPNLYYSIKNPYSNEEVWPSKTRVWGYGKDLCDEHARQGLLWWGKDGTNKVPSFKRHLSTVVDDGVVPQTIWLWEDVGHTQDGRKEQLSLLGLNPFSTPKPEKLLKQLLELSTNPGDLVLDSFLGSGTTAAVAHKMGRRWIGIELGDHCTTHCLPRLKKVVDGQDPGGITEAVSWKGGGGFKFYELAPSLLNKDEFGNFVISSEYNATMLAAAMAKHEGFRFSPDATVYWKQGKSTERDYIFTTTNMLTVQEVERIAGDMPSGETLLICCKAYQDGVPRVSPFITVKKIPHMLLGRCEFDKNDYSLHIVPAPKDEDAEDDATTDDSMDKGQEADTSAKKKGRKGKAKQGPDLFGEEE